MLLGCTDGRHHSQLRQSTLGDHREARRGDECDQQHHDRRHDEDDHRGNEVLGNIATRRHLPISVTGWPEGLNLILAGVDEHRHEVCVGEARLRQEDELVIEVAGVLDDAHDGARRAVQIDRRADLASSVSASQSVTAASSTVAG